MLYTLSSLLVPSKRTFVPGSRYLLSKAEAPTPTSREVQGGPNTKTEAKAHAGWTEFMHAPPCLENTYVHMYVEMAHYAQEKEQEHPQMILSRTT